MIFLTTSNLASKTRRLLTPFTDHPYKTLVVVLIFWFLEWYWGFEASFFITLFFLFLLLKLESWILIFFALIFLVSCPIYLLFDNRYRAEQMAVYAYYLLFIGTVLALIEQIKAKKEKNDDEKLDDKT